MARFDLRDFKKQASFFLRERLNDARVALTDVSRIQLLTEEATNEDSWGPESRTMAVLADAAFDLEEYERIVQVIHCRLEVSKRRPCRQLYKTLVLMEYLLTHGPNSLGKEFREYCTCVEELLNYSFTDQQGIDRGLMVRKMADRVLELINNPDFRREERNRTRKISVGIRGFGCSLSPEPPQNGVHGAVGQSWQGDVMQHSASSLDNLPEGTGNAAIGIPHLEGKHVLYGKSVSLLSRSAQEAMPLSPQKKGNAETRIYKKSLSSVGFFRERLSYFSQQSGDEAESKLEEEHTGLLDAVEEKESSSCDQLREESKENHLLMRWPSTGSTEDGSRVALSENTHARPETTDRFLLAESCKLSMPWCGGEKPSLDTFDGEWHPKLRAKCEHQWQPASLITCDSKFGQAA